MVLGLIRWLKYDLVGDVHSKHHYVEIRKLEKQRALYSKKINELKSHLKAMSSVKSNEADSRRRQVNSAISTFEDYIKRINHAISALDKNFILQKKYRHKPQSRWLLIRSQRAQRELQSALLALEQR